MCTLNSYLYLTTSDFVMQQLQITSFSPQCQAYPIVIGAFSFSFFFGFRFNDWNAEKCPDGQYPLDYGLHSGRLRTTINSVPAKFQGGFESGSERFKRIKRTLKYCSFNSFVNKGLGSGKKVLDPQGAFLQKWNKIFVLSCVIAVSLDPLFFYVPVINGDRKCVDLDKKMETTASVLRSFTDIFYIFHIILQFRTGFIAPSSRVFGRGVLVEDTWLIAKKYMSSHFLVDILAVLPLPQVSEIFYALTAKGFLVYLIVSTGWRINAPSKCCHFVMIIITGFLIAVRTGSDFDHNS